MEAIFISGERVSKALKFTFHIHQLNNNHLLNQRRGFACQFRFFVFNAYYISVILWGSDL